MYRAYRIVTDKNTSQDDYWLRVFTLPFTVITTIVNQPARTLTKLFSLAVGSAMSYPGKYKYTIAQYSSILINETTLADFFFQDIY